ncbi:ATP-binding protein [Nocardioides dongxiaopingii]|uniref:ATP-binding protein n=1 Tax=Nocardioides sp. S-1144 TaxID=2582905 RepID=UPI0011652E3D|nr:ATP-binding protein [Nocardioides sp. S-1144]QDH11193.1 ATP-binding protein [Nocardioides sp. S-1144]
MTTATDATSAPAAFLRFADAALDWALGDQDDDAATALAHAREDLATDPTAEPATDGFTALCANAGADAAARELLAILLACETDLTRTARLATLTGSGRPGRLTLGAAARLLGGVGACVAATGPSSALRRAALVGLLEHQGPWSTTEVVLAPSVVWAIGGDQSPDPDLPVGAWMMEGPPGGSTSTAVEDGLVLVAGPDPVRRRALVAQQRGADVYLVTPAPTTPDGWAAVVREATITGSGVLVEVGDDLPPAGRQWIDRATHLAWALSSTDDIPLAELPERPRVELRASDDVVTEEEWRSVFGPDAPRTHRLTAHQLEQVGSALPAVGGDLDLAVRRLLAGPMGRLARRIRPRKTWDDLILSEPRVDQLRTVVARFRQAGTVYDDWGVTSASGRGIISLFTGPSGTGKSLAAEVVAHTLGLDLYRVDLSSVVSKYIGETEQNLEKLFAAASAGSAVLFFDEADSLFGKRSEVKDGRDRYANLEVSYLLQRLESYDGVVVLATNLPKNIDDAFLRRIHEVVSFTLPAVDERRAIWTHHLADGDIPLGELDVDRLAQRFEVAGGIIRNVVVSAAFRAADEGTPVTMDHLLAALAGEYKKLGRMLNPEDFDA